MHKVLMLAALGSLAFAPAAHATLESLTFVGYGGGYQPPTPPPGESLITGFSSSAGLTGSYLLVTGTTGDYAAPAYSTTTRDPNQYLAIEGGDTATLSLGASSALPEPSTWAMLVLGLAGLGYAAYRKPRSSISIA